jgi:hypothetical protein
MLKKIQKAFKKFSLENIILIAIILFAFLLRVYRINDLLGFYYDQGRDALVIWDLIHNGKFFLIGPTTGIAGIFRGPYYYYLITPFYLLGRGNPIYPSVFLSFLTTVAIYVLYKLVKKADSYQSALIAAILSSFSYYLVIASRWLSNPTPMFLLSVLLILGMYLVLENKKFGWEIIAFTSGLSLFNFGSSGELFYFPAILIFLIWQWKKRPKNKSLISTGLAFFVTCVPLLIFDVRHGGILRNNFLTSFVSEKSFTLPTKFLLEQRITFYYEVFSKILFHVRGRYEIILMMVLLLSLIIFLKGFFKNNYIKTVLLLLFSPIVGLCFYQGNDKVLYEYYLTGYYLIFIFIVSIILGKIWKNIFGKIFVFVFIFVFLINNFSVLKYKLSDKVDREGSIALKNELQIVNWVFDNAGSEEFNVDVYVPPVIPYAYDYLFKWKSYSYKKPNYKEQDRVKLLYTIYEEDSLHPDRLTAWKERQKGIGKIIEEKRIGGLTVQKRIRI